MKIAIICVCVAGVFACTLALVRIIFEQSEKIKRRDDVIKAQDNLIKVQKIRLAWLRSKVGEADAD